MKKKQDILELFLIVGILIFLNIIINKYFFRLDFTEDKRYTLSPVTKNILTKLEGDVHVEVFLSGDLNPNYERLKKSIQEKLEQFKAHSSKQFTYRFIDPNAEEDKTLRERFHMLLYKRGIKPSYYLDEKNGQKTEKFIFPGAIVSYQTKEAPVMFLKGNKVASQEEQLNQSVESIEFELLQGFRQLTTKEYKTITLVDGHGEPSKERFLEISNALNKVYNLQRRKLDSLNVLDNSDVVLIASPTIPFTEKEKFILDQYVTKGGRLLIAMDQADIRKDSLKNGVTYGLEKHLNLNDLFFKYGFRMNQNAVSDLNCATTVIQTGLNGESQALSFPYYPIIYQFGKHSITKSLDAIKLVFAGTIDTVKSEGVNKTVLLQTSTQSKVLNAPFQIDLDFLKRNSDPESFTAGPQITGLLLEGRFTSLFKNKPSPWSGTSVNDTSVASKIIVLSDGDLILNEMDPRRMEAIPLGYDKDMRYQFSNKELIMNAIDYLMDQELMEVRTKEVKLRPLDKEEMRNRSFFWKFLNIAIPILVIVCYGVFKHIQRKKRFGSF
jgi:gliding-associated putative ABC transporter substrate-binding component GldG